MLGQVLTRPVLIIWCHITSVYPNVFTVDARMTYRFRDNQRVDVEGQEQAVEEVVGQHIIKEFTVDDEDIVQVVQVVQVLRYQVTQLPSVPMSGTQQRQTQTLLSKEVNLLYWFVK